MGESEGGRGRKEGDKLSEENRIDVLLETYHPPYRNQDHDQIDR